jgi:hypothetical protein
MLVEQYLFCAQLPNVVYHNNIEDDLWKFFRHLQFCFGCQSKLLREKLLWLIFVVQKTWIMCHL